MTRELRPDLDALLAQLEADAASGSVVSNAMLGMMILHQSGDVDLEKAARCLKFAAEAGAPRASAYWGSMLWRGVGCKRNLDEAERHLEIAEGAGEPIGALELARLRVHRALGGYDRVRELDELGEWSKEATELAAWVAALPLPWHVAPQ